MATWVCATCGPVPAGEIRHLDHDSPHGNERHECGSSAGLDWTKTKEHDMTTDPRIGTTIPAGEPVEGAAALVSAWLMENTDSVKERVEFVRYLDEFLTDFDFTLGCVKALAPGLPDQAVKAVVDLAEKYDQQYRRAEAAHDAKDEANRRWLEAAKAAEPPREEVATTVRSCSDKNGHHDPHDWRPDPSGGIEWCPGYPVPPAPALADDEPTAS